MITNLELKLKGKEPVTREELFILVNSWGRKDSVHTNDNLIMYECNSKECFDLSNLDVSKINDLSYIFRDSYYNGDLSKWDVSNCFTFERMFSYSNFDNDSLKNWNTSKLKDIELIFYKSRFNGDISNWKTNRIVNMICAFEHTTFNRDISKWDVSKVLNMQSLFAYSDFNGDISKWNFHKNVNCNYIIAYNNDFINKYNSKDYIDTKDFLEWFEANRENISNLNITEEELIDINDYLDTFDEINYIKS